ncbi:hypothetical protein BGW41_007850 [Actinomortierella wolfii]|nr:hypothetical protein BGW41_007850 [Actinomortierella wolfii]
MMQSATHKLKVQTQVPKQGLDYNAILARGFPFTPVSRMSVKNADAGDLLEAVERTCVKDGTPLVIEGYVPQDLVAENLMVYIGAGGTWTPAHFDQCGVIGHNIMTFAAEDSYALWFMINSSDVMKAQKLWNSFGHPLDYESYFASVDELQNADFPIYVVQQKLGDLIMVPSLCVHQVVNMGSVTAKASWNRMTAPGMDFAVNMVLPRYQEICRPEGYRIKTVIKYGLEKCTELLESGSNNFPLGRARFARDFRILINLFFKNIEEEWVDSTILIGSTQPFVKPPRLAQDITGTCDYCKADLWNRQFHCIHCTSSADEDMGYDLCLRCYALGRGCKHRAQMRFVEASSMRSCRELWCRAANAWNNSTEMKLVDGFETIPLLLKKRVPTRSSTPYSIGTIAYYRYVSVPHRQKIPCHNCKTIKDNLMYQQCSRRDNSHVFCEECMFKVYGEIWSDIKTQKEEWMCYICLDQCRCATCKPNEVTQEAHISIDSPSSTTASSGSSTSTQANGPSSNHSARKRKRISKPLSGDTPLDQASSSLSSNRSPERLWFTRPDDDPRNQSAISDVLPTEDKILEVSSDDEYTPIPKRPRQKQEPLPKRLHRSDTSPPVASADSPAAAIPVSKLSATTTVSSSMKSGVSASIESTQTSSVDLTLTPTPPPTLPLVANATGSTSTSTPLETFAAPSQPSSSTIRRELLKNSCQQTVLQAKTSKEEHASPINRAESGSNIFKCLDLLHQYGFQKTINAIATVPDERMRFLMDMYKVDKMLADQGKQFAEARAVLQDEILSKIFTDDLDRLPKRLNELSPSLKIRKRKQQRVGENKKTPEYLARWIQRIARAKAADFQASLFTDHGRRSLLPGYVESRGRPRVPENIQPHIRHKSRNRRGLEAIEKQEEGDEEEDKMRDCDTDDEFVDKRVERTAGSAGTAKRLSRVRPESRNPSGTHGTTHSVRKRTLLLVSESEDESGVASDDNADNHSEDENTFLPRSPQQQQQQQYQQQLPKHKRLAKRSIKFSSPPQPDLSRRRWIVEVDLTSRHPVSQGKDKKEVGSSSAVALGDEPGPSNTLDGKPATLDALDVEPAPSDALDEEPATLDALDEEPGIPDTIDEEPAPLDALSDESTPSNAPMEVDGTVAAEAASITVDRKKEDRKIEDETSNKKVIPNSLQNLCLDNEKTQSEPICMPTTQSQMISPPCQESGQAIISMIPPLSFPLPESFLLPIQQTPLASHLTPFMQPQLLQELPLFSAAVPPSNQTPSHSDLQSSPSSEQHIEKFREWCNP